jgi:hypothetical protein
MKPARARYSGPKQRLGQPDIQNHHGHGLTYQKPAVMDLQAAHSNQVQVTGLQQFHH